MRSREAGSVRENEPHRQRQAAESFGSDPERYDRARPRYPDVLIERIVAAAPGGLVLDVGVGTGIVARQFQAAGCQVLGVDPDARLAEFARRSGVAVEVPSFEVWEAAGRQSGGGEGGPGAAAWWSFGRVLEHGPAARGPRGGLRRGLSPRVAGVARRPLGEKID